MLNRLGNITFFCLETTATTTLELLPSQISGFYIHSKNGGSFYFNMVYLRWLKRAMFLLLFNHIYSISHFDVQDRTSMYEIELQLRDRICDYK